MHRGPSTPTRIHFALWGRRPSFAAGRYPRLTRPHCDSPFSFRRMVSFTYNPVPALAGHQKYQNPWTVKEGRISECRQRDPSETKNVTMTLPGETDASSRWIEPWRGIAWRAHRDDDPGRENEFFAPPEPASSDLTAQDLPIGAQPREDCGARLRSASRPFCWPVFLRHL